MLVFFLMFWSVRVDIIDGVIVPSSIQTRSACLLPFSDRINLIKFFFHRSAKTSTPDDNGAQTTFLAVVMYRLISL